MEEHVKNCIAGNLSSLYATWSTKRALACEKKFSEIRADKDTRRVLSVWR